MNDGDEDEPRIMNHMEEQMQRTTGRGHQLLPLYSTKQSTAKNQSAAIGLLVTNLTRLVHATDAEEETKELCNELCLTAEFFNKILQSEKFENIPF